MGPEFFMAAAGFVGAGLHPFATYPLSLALLARTHRRPVMTSDPVIPGREIALCVCAYNEERIIRAKAENMVAMRRALPGLQLLIYVDASTDRTAAILREWEKDIRVIVSPARQGKTHGMNRLIAATDASFLVFSDANVMFAPDAVPRLMARFADPSVGCVCGHLIYTDAAGSATAAIGSTYWKLEEKIKELESLSGSTMGADGSIFAIRRALHEPPPPDIIDDMYVSLSILCRGYRVVRANDAIAYEETVSRPGEEFRRKTRIACQAFNVHRLLRPRLRRLPLLDKYKYVSHKLLRWVSVYLLAAGGICLLAGLASLGAWSALIALLLVGAAAFLTGLLMPSGPFGKLLDIAAAFTATGLGVLRSLRGDRYQTWTPPESARSGG